MTGLGFALVLTVFATTDGDTFKARTSPDADPIAIRLFAIDTPERGQPGYRESRLHLQSLVLGQKLLCEAMGLNGGRIVAVCRRDGDGVDPAEGQVKAGLATACPDYSDRYLAFEKPGLVRAPNCTKDDEP